MSFFLDKKPADWERLYRQGKLLIETMPTLDYAHHEHHDVMEWLGKAYAFVKEVGEGADDVRVTTGINYLATASWPQGAHEIRSAVYRALAVAETKAPEGAAGVFIAAGGHFDVFAALAKVFGTATSDVLLIDAYMDQTALTDFAATVPERVTLRLMADEASVKDTLKPAVERWKHQHGANRPLEARLAPRYALHDRAIFVDQKRVWLVSQSLNKIVNRSPATITQADDEVSAGKIAAYEAIWKGAKPL